MIIEIPKETQYKVLMEFNEFLEHKIKKKGENSFNSLPEIAGKLLEEFNEVAEELHRKDKDNFKQELFDVAVVALWGAMSVESWKDRK
jgi:NTP pyrophosphatase (non-canonical NTP hydrolase)